MDLDEDVKKAKLDKIRAETKNVEWGRWQFLWKALLAAIIAVPIMWFYFHEVAVPLHSVENLQLARENEVVRDSLVSIAEDFDRERLRLIDEQERLLQRVAELEEIPDMTPIDLSMGWNLIGYSGSDVLSSEAAFETISDALLIARDNRGNLFYPEAGVRSLTSIEPGRGYMVYVTENAVLTFPEP